MKDDQTLNFKCDKGGKKEIGSRNIYELKLKWLGDQLNVEKLKLLRRSIDPQIKEKHIRKQDLEKGW